MNHPLHRVVQFEQRGTYTLRVVFEDGTSQTINFEPVLVGAIYGPLADPKLFAKVQIDDEVHTLVWPNGADFDPATLHDWPEHEPAWHARAAKWQRVGA